MKPAGERTGRRPAGSGSGARARPMLGFVVVALVVCLVVAGWVSSFASGSPDGLERVAEDEGIAETARDHPLADSPVSDYAVRGLGDGRLAGGAAGVAGVLATLLVAAGIPLAARRFARSAAPDAGSP